MKKVIMVILGIIVLILISLFIIKPLLEKNPKTYTRMVNTKISTKSKKINGISLTEFYIKNGKKKPVIILSHGLSQSMQNMYYAAAKLADDGFFVITPDAYAHGQTDSDLELSVIEIILKSSENIDTILDNYKDNSEADITKLGLGGFSMGAEISYHYAAYGEYDTTTLVSVCGTPDFEELEKSEVVYSKYFKTKWEDITSVSERSYANNIMKKSNPLNHMERLQNINILIEISENDDVIPIENSKIFYETISNTSPSSKLKNYTDNGHQFTNNNIADMEKYFKENLY